MRQAAPGALPMALWRWLVAVPMLGVHMACLAAGPLAFDYRCGVEPAAEVLALPADGWTAAAAGLLPPAAGNPCWLRVPRAPPDREALSITGEGGFKRIVLFDAEGRELARADDFGGRSHAIVSAGTRSARSLFPDLPALAGPLYVRVDRERVAVRLTSVDASRTAEADRDYAQFHLAMAVAMAAITVFTLALVIANREWLPVLFAAYFGVAMVGELFWIRTALPFAWPRPLMEVWWAAFYPLLAVGLPTVSAVLLRTRGRLPRENRMFVWLISAGVVNLLLSPFEWPLGSNGR